MHAQPCSAGRNPRECKAQTRTIDDRIPRIRQASGATLGANEAHHVEVITPRRRAGLAAAFRIQVTTAEDGQRATIASQKRGCSALLMTIIRSPYHRRVAARYVITDQEKVAATPGRGGSAGARDHSTGFRLSDDVRDRHPPPRRPSGPPAEPLRHVCVVRCPDGDDRPLAGGLR